MAIPDFQTLMLPLLVFASDGEEHMPRDAVKNLADKFQLSPEERVQMLPSGRVTVMQNRVAWANAYMKKAGLLESVRRGVFRITSRGRQLANLMMDFDVGVAPVATYTVKRIDSDYFEET